MDSKNLIDKDKPSPGGEYFFFRCPRCGYDNYIHVENTANYQRIKDEVVVECQKCKWKSPSFKPTLFQHSSGGDFLLWVYTTKESSSINSVLNLSFAENKEGKPMGQPAIAPKLSDSQKLIPIKKDLQEEPRDVVDTEGKLTLEDQEKTLRIKRQMVLQSQPPEPKFPGDTELPPSIGKLEDTVEIPLQERMGKPDQTMRIGGKGALFPGQEGEQKYYHYFPENIPPLKIPQSFLPHLVTHGLWILAFCIFSFLGLQTCNEQGNKITQAIRSIEMPAVPSYPIQPVKTNGEEKDPKLLEVKHRGLEQQHKELQENLARQEKTYKELQEAYKALTVSYETEYRSQKELKGKIEKLTQEYETLKKQHEKSAQSYQEMVDALTHEFKVEQLSKAEEDFHDPSLSRDGKFLIFYREESVAQQQYRQSLKIAFFSYTGLRYFELFTTPAFKTKQRGIPFLYSWDGKENIVILTRIEGENTLYHIVFQAIEERVRILKNKKIYSTSHPEVLGPPSLSPNGRYMAFVHKTDPEMWVKVYHLEDDSFKAKTVGGGDAGRIPAWSPDGGKLYFLTQECTGIVQWDIFNPRQKESKSFPREIYGRYLSCSPKGAHLAFFQKSEEGKGKVDLCRWDIKKGEVDIVDRNLTTTETCSPAWSPESRFLCILHNQTQDHLVLYDTKTNAKFQIFKQTGNIQWIDWTYPTILTFSYREGIFTRPYLVHFVSWFAKY